MLHYIYYRVLHPLPVSGTEGSPPSSPKAPAAHPTLPPTLLKDCRQLFDHFCEDAGVPSPPPAPVLIQKP